jgi:hypothetical protein
MAFVAMPETTVDEDNRAIFGENHIRLPRKVPVMQAIAEAQPMQSLSNHQFWPSVLTADTRHHLGTCSFINHISHGFCK